MYAQSVHRLLAYPSVRTNINCWHEYCSICRYMEKMTFTTDRTSLTEGDVITVTWDCHEAERVELSIDNGYKATAIPLELSGEKRFRLNRSKGRTKLTITAWVAGKHYSKTIKVKVSEMQATRAETVGDDYATRPPQKGLAGWWREMTVRWNMAWQAMPPAKKLATRILAVLAAILLFWPLLRWILPIGLLALCAYLLWFIWKK